MSADVKVLGRLVRDPVKRDFGSNSSFAAFTFVTDSGAKGQDGKRKPLFIDVSAWGKQGDTILQYCKKGTQLLITGTIYDNTTFNSKNGEAVAKLTLTLEKFEFTGQPKSNSDSQSKPKQQQNYNNNNNYLRGEPVDDMDIPF